MGEGGRGSAGGAGRPQKDSPSKPSVAELAGRFKGHILPMPSQHDQLPFRRKPPCSLKLRNPPDANEESDRATAFPAPSRIKIKNSAIIEKLQANLALSPTALLPSPKSPEVKLQPALSPPPLAPPSAATPCSPQSPTQPPSHPSSEDEEPVSFQSPPEGALLPSINKTRARLSFKRRPPTRQHRRSAGDEAGLFTGGGEGGSSPSELCSPRENGDRDQVFHCPEEQEEAEDREEEGQRGGVRASESKNCEETDGEVMKCDPEEKKKEEEEEEEEGGPGEVGAEDSEPLEEKRLPSEPAEQIEGAMETEALQEENDRM